MKTQIDVINSLSKWSAIGLIFVTNICVAGDNTVFTLPFGFTISTSSLVVALFVVGGIVVLSIVIAIFNAIFGGTSQNINIVNSKNVGVKNVQNRDVQYRERKNVVEEDDDNNLVL